MSPVQRLVAIGVAVLAVVGGAVVAVNLADGPSGGATASPSASASAPQATASPPGGPSASAPTEDEVLAALHEIEQQVISIRGLPAADIGPPELITRAELAGELQRIFDEDYPAEDRERDTIALRALGLLAEGEDIAALQLQLLGDQVLGFYDDVDQRMVIVTDAGLDALARMTYAHEYTHALQDAAFGLDSLDADAVGEDDRGLARTALIEGDASVVMLAWAFANLTPEELMEVGLGAQLPDTTGIPAWLVAQLEFPYTDGLNWASVLVGNPLEPDFAPIDAAFGDPPDSTEQIIDIGAWDPREDPVAVGAVDLAAALGDGWENVDDTPVGQAMISIMLQYHGVAGGTALEAASGWGGDRVSIASAADGSFALAWRLEWDTPADAAEFVAAYGGIVDGLGFPARVVELADDATLVVHASTDGLLRQAEDAAGD
jgi:hypothetical protein